MDRNWGGCASRNRHWYHRASPRPGRHIIYIGAHGVQTAEMTDRIVKSSHQQLTHGTRNGHLQRLLGLYISRRSEVRMDGRAKRKIARDSYRAGALGHSSNSNTERRSPAICPGSIFLSRFLSSMAANQCIFFRFRSICRHSQWVGILRSGGPMGSICMTKLLDASGRLAIIVGLRPKSAELQARGQNSPHTDRVARAEAVWWLWL